MKSIIYQDEKGYWIKVCKFTDDCLYKATTNGMLYEALNKLDYCRSEEEAQKELDGFAKKHNLKEVERKI